MFCCARAPKILGLTGTWLEASRYDQENLICGKGYLVARSKLVLAVGLDGHVGCGIGHASEAKALAHLVIIQEGLVALINAAREHLAGAAGAGASAARVRQLQALLLSLIQHVHVLRAVEGLGAIRSLQGHLEVGWHAGPSRNRAHDGRHIARGQGTAGQSLAAQVDALLGRHEGQLCIACAPEAAQDCGTAGRSQQGRKHTRLGGHDCCRSGDFYPLRSTGEPSGCV